MKKVEISYTVKDNQDDSPKKKSKYGVLYDYGKLNGTKKKNSEEIVAQRKPEETNTPVLSPRPGSVASKRSCRPIQTSSNIVRDSNETMKWNNSSSMINKDFVLMDLDDEIADFRYRLNNKARVHVADSLSHQSIPKDLPSRRIRYPIDTNGGIVGLNNTNISKSDSQKSNWNISTKDKDEEERMKPSGQCGKNHEAFLEQRYFLHPLPDSISKQKSVSEFQDAL